MAEGKIKLGIPYKGTIIGVEVPEKVAILGMKIGTKNLLMGLAGIFGVAFIIVLLMFLPSRNAAQKSTDESQTLQG